MPIYVYRCERCGFKKSEYRTINNDLPCPTCTEPGCETVMIKIPAAPASSKITEKDPVRGKHIKRGVTEELKKRSHEHFQKYEIDDLIEEHGINSAKDFGWLDRKTGKKIKPIDEK